MTRRRSNVRRGNRGQAVIEMAMMIPLVFALVVNFLGVMIEVEMKAQLTAAVSLAAQSSITVPVKDANASCKNASRSLAFTAFSQTSYDPSGSWCSGTANSASYFQVGSPTGTACIAVSAAGHPSDSGLCLTYFRCDGSGYFDGTFYNGGASGPTGPPVTCQIKATYDFTKTPLAFGILWKPTFDIQAQATPTTVRQCFSASC